MSVSMCNLFPMCAKILQEEMTPLHYTALTERALIRLGGPATLETLRRAKEDVREKCLLEGRYGTAYVAKPYYVAVLRGWFPSDQALLFNTDAKVLRISGNAKDGFMAAFEVLMRFQHMQTKVADTKSRRQGAARGLVIETHVKSWFQHKWPQFYRPPDNEGQFTQYCFHDFKLHVNGQTIEVDVMGPQWDGQFGLSQGKSPVDIHVMASIDRGDIILHGYLTKAHLSSPIGSRFSAMNIYPPLWLIVWLNCQANSISYSKLSELVFAYC